MTDDLLTEVMRREGGRVVATLTRRLGSLDLAEDAVHDAVVRALEVWPEQGVPGNPAAWLTAVARNAALDRLRRENNRGPKEEAAMAYLQAEPDPAPESSMVRDDLLRLLFTCCHPALAEPAQIALSLKTLGGLSTEEIARAFLVPEPTMAQRLVRAKKKISAAHIPYRVPSDHELPDRLASVCRVVYLIFTEGHHSTGGSGPVRVDLADEAIRLGRLLVELMPDVPECAGLLALMLATHARRAARLDDRGDVVLLDDQDRSLWKHDEIAEAAELIDRAIRSRQPGPYQTQAAIACLHGLAPTAAETDWPQIAELYGLLEGQMPTPVVRVNRAVAVDRALGPEAGLAALDTVSGVDEWHLYHAARADMCRRLGRIDDARAAYEQALECNCNDADRRFLLARLESLD